MRGSHGCRAYFGQRHFCWLRPYILWASGLFGSKVSFRRRDFHGGLPTLRRIEVDGLRVGPSRGCCPVSHIYMDSERQHNIHAYEAWWRLQAHDNNEAGSPVSLTPLNVEMMGFHFNLEGFTVCTMHCSLKLRQVTEAPVSTRPRTGMHSRVSWPVMGGPTGHPTGVTLALGDPPSILNAPGGSLGCFLAWEA